MFRERSVMPHRRPSPLRVVTWFIIMFVFGMLFWASLAKVPEVARTRGQVIPVGDIITIQALEGGQLVELFVREGQEVSKGQVLARFEPIKAETDVNQLVSRTAYLELEAERLAAFVEGRNADFSKFSKAYYPFVLQERQVLYAQKEEMRTRLLALNEQLKQKEKTLAAIDAKLPVLRGQLTSSAEVSSLYRALGKQNITSKLELLNAQQREAEFRKEMAELKGTQQVLLKEIEEVKQQIENAKQGIYTEAQRERSKVLLELAEAKLRLKERRSSLQRHIIVSPAKGIVKELPFQSPRAVVTPGEIVAEVVPVDVDLIVEVQISPRDIGFVEVGQPVTIRIDTFDYSRYGALPGTLDHISPTTFTGPNGELYYVGEVVPERSYIGDKSAKRQIFPGMTAEVDITTGQKTVLQYLLKPIFTLTEKGFTER